MPGKSSNEIGFLDSFRAETAIVPEIIDQLIKNLKEVSYSQDEINEIVLSMDEAITNAVQETISTNHTNRGNLEERRQITIRYKITEEQFDATVIDHGKGLDIEQMMKQTPSKDSQFYHNQIFDYVNSSAKKKLKVRINGKEVTLNGIGAGLKIILSFMDSVTIDLIDKKDVVSDSISETTDGTILNLKRKRKEK